MSLVTVKFNGIWKLYTGTSSDNIQADNVDEALSKIEHKYEGKFKEKWKERGIVAQGSMIKFTYAALNNKDVRQLVDRSLKDGDVLDLFLIIPGG